MPCILYLQHRCSPELATSSVQIPSQTIIFFDTFQTFKSKAPASAARSQVQNGSLQFLRRIRNGCDRSSELRRLLHGSREPTSGNAIYYSHYRSFHRRINLQRHRTKSTDKKVGRLGLLRGYPWLLPDFHFMPTLLY